MFVMKKLGFTEETFAAYMKAPGVPHDAYGSELPFYQTLLKINRIYKGTPAHADAG